MKSTTRLWIVQNGERRLIELARSMYSSTEAYQEAIGFWIERGAEEEE